MPIGHAVNANLAMVSNFSVHHDRAEAIRRGQEGFEFFGYRGQRAGRARRRARPLQSVGRLFQAARQPHEEIIDATARRRDAIVRHRHAGRYPQAHPGFQEAGVDQVIFLQQAGRNKHEHICESLELFAAEVMPEFKAEAAAREARKAEELAPYIAAALTRKQWMQPLAEHEIPVVKASVERAQRAHTLRGAVAR